MIKLFREYKLRDWLVLLVTLIFTFIQVAFTMGIVTKIGEITAAINSAKTEEDMANILSIGLVMVAFALGLVVVQIIVELLASWLASDIVTNVRTKLYKRVNDFSLQDLSQFSTESLITRTTNDLQQVHLALLTAFRTIFLAPIMIIASIIALRKSDPALLSTTGIWVFILVAVVVVVVLLLMPKFKIIQKLTDKLNVESRENLTGVRVVRAFNAEKYQEEKFSKVNFEFTKNQIFAGKAIALLVPFIMFVMFALQTTILAVSAIIIKGKGPEALEYFNSINPMIMLANQIIISFVLLLAMIVVLPRASVAAKRINEVLDHKISIIDPENPVPFTEKGTIEFKNVSFKYPGGDGEAISDITFKVKQGETIAFIGATGSGKTTIINMMPRLFDVTKGEVLIDGVNVKDVKQEDLRNIIGYTPQRGYLFEGDIKSNIAFSNPDMPIEQIEKAAKVAEAYEFVSKIDKGFDSHVAQGGTNFSGGQKQRLCIARSVAKQPEILIFDDSFSALDYKTDRQVRTNIKEFDSKATRVIIAARIGTIMDAEQIVVLDKGKMVGIGKHEDLLKTCDVYKEIAYSQLSKEELENE